MPREIYIKATHKAIDAFYKRRSEIAAQGTTNEMGVRDAFNVLLQTLARETQWTMVPEQTIAVPGGYIRPDGTLYDASRYPRGYWESKDSADDLEYEISRKIAKHYPLSNTIFENGSVAVLYQNKVRIDQFELSRPDDIAKLFNQYLNHEEPAVARFEGEVSRFKEQTPQLAKELREAIQQAHQTNRSFQAAFEQFLEICRGALDPRLSADAVDDMLVQHLLTERLMRTVFGNTEFRSNNVIAAEVEKVIRALTAGHFNREEYLGKLNHFYAAIEDAAATITDFHEKQGFISTVYERFFQGYSTKVADTHGIVYTPQPIVAWMVAAVDAALKDAYRNRLFANEVLLMPYYVASLMPIVTTSLGYSSAKTSLWTVPGASSILQKMWTIMSSAFT